MDAVRLLNVQICTAGPNTLVTSRKPDDLKAYCQEANEIFASG
jgi:protease I